MRPPIVPSPMKPILIRSSRSELFLDPASRPPYDRLPAAQISYSKGAMESFFEWLQALSVSNWIATDESIWSFPTILFFHSVGMGLTAGVMFMVCLRLVGVGRPLPVSSLRMLFRIFWWGFVLNAITGSLLFAAHATITGNQPIYYAKLTLIALGVVLSLIHISEPTRLLSI